MKTVSGSGFILTVLVLNNENCKWKWFHFDCVGINREPKSNLWYCPDCRKLPPFKTTKNRK